MPLPLVQRSPGDAGHIADHNSLADAVDEPLAGKPFISAAAFSARAESAVLTGGGDCETTTGWVSTNTASPTADGSQKTQGTKSIKFGQVDVGFDTNNDLTTKMYLNLSSGTSRGTYSHLALDMRWDEAGTPMGYHLGEVFELVVSDAVDLGGTLVTYPVPYISRVTWTTIRIPILGLSTVRSIGLRSIGVIDFAGDLGRQALVWFDNMRLAAQTELEAALASSTTNTVLVPPDYSASTPVLDIEPTHTVIDTRPGFSIISNLNGRKYVRQFQAVPEDGTDAAPAINTILSLLEDGDTLEFPHNARLLVRTSQIINGTNRVTINYNGCKMYTDVRQFDSGMLRIENNRFLRVNDPRFYGYNPITELGSTFTSYAGTPTIGSGVSVLAARGDAVKMNIEQGYGINIDDVAPFTFTISQSADPSVVKDDVRFDVIDPEAPTTLLTATASGTDGPVPAGTHYYAVTFFDLDMRETTVGPAQVLTTAAGSTVDLTNIPVPTGSEEVRIIARRIYRTTAESTSSDPRAMRRIGVINDVTTTTFTDRNTDANNARPTSTFAVADGGAGSLPAGTYNYRFTAVAADGSETVASGKKSVTIAASHQITVTVPAGPAGTIRRKIYRTVVNDTESTRIDHAFYVGQINDNTTPTFTDNVLDGSLGAVAPESISGVTPSVWGSETFTPSATPAEHTFAWRVGDHRANPTVTVTKTTTATNTITVAQVVTTTRANYTSGSTGREDGGTAIVVGDGNYDVEVNRPFASVVGADCVNIQGRTSTKILINEGLAFGTCRQGFAAVNGREITFRRCVAKDPARSGLDVEPTGGANCFRVRIEDFECRNPTNFALAFENWNKIYDIHIDGLLHVGGGGAFTGGGMMGSMRNVTSYSGVALLKGQNMTLVDSTVKNLTLKEDEREVDGAFFNAGGHIVDEVRLLETIPETDDYLVEESSGNQIGTVYIISGAPVVDPTATVWTP